MGAACIPHRQMGALERLGFQTTLREVQLAEAVAFWNTEALP